MRYGVIGTAGSATQQVELAQRAEAAGWDGYFTWDGISISFNNTGANQDGCKGATVNLAYTLS